MDELARCCRALSARWSGVWAGRLALVGMALATGACASNQSLRVEPYATSRLTFGTCPQELEAAAEGECALVEVPLDWEQPEASERIVVFVRRFRSTANASGAGQVWALDGGPGFAGDVFVDPAIRGVVLEAGYDLYVPTHRGTVYGTALTCPAEQAPASDGGGAVTVEEFPACVAALRNQWGDALGHFNSQAAARDVEYLIERTREPDGGTVVAYGGSYGSLWGQRLLQVAPNVLDGMWLDSIVDLDASFERAGENAHDAGLALLRACAEDAGCGKHLPADVDEMVSEVVAQYRDGKGCGQGDRPLAAIRLLFNRLLSGAPWDQALVAPLLVRAHRCSADDEAEIQHALAELERQPGAASIPYAYNPVLNRHMMLAEMFRYDRGPEDVAVGSQTQLFSANGDGTMASLAATYPEDARITLPVDVPATRAHVVLWQGGLDPLDRPDWARRTAKRWSASRVTLVEVPRAGHSVVRYAVTQDGRHCAMEMFSAFLSDPSAPLDRSCLSLVPELDLAATESETLQAAEKWFGIAQPWKSDDPRSSPKPEDEQRAPDGLDALSEPVP